MSERKEGWYYIRMPSAAWECVYWNGNRWESHEYTELYDSDIDVIGARIPAPDEPWQCVPKALNMAMVEEFEDRLAEQGWSHEAAGEIDKQDLWDAQLSASPSPDDTA